MGGSEVTLEKFWWVPGGPLLRPLARPDSRPRAPVACPLRSFRRSGPLTLLRLLEPLPSASEPFRALRGPRKG